MPQTELTRDDAGARGARRILCAQIDDALETLAGQRVSDSDIHGARKSLKRARATLRLMRDAIPKSAYRRENAALRDAARPLSASRDARVLLDTLDRLEDLYGPAAKRGIPIAFRRALAPERPKLSRAPKRSLTAARQRITRARMSANGWDELGSGLMRVYAHGHKAMKQAQRTPTPDCFHEWRKQAKYLWHQLQVLEPLRPGPICALADRTHELSDYLGDDHDLAVLRKKVTAHADVFKGPGGPAALLALIDRCQQRLRAKAMRAGARIYAEKPAVFAASFGRYWKQWQSDHTR